jgi:energy-coupling factor transport system ATP-binding protein
MIICNNLNFSYTNGSQVLKEVSFNINSGEFVAIIGQNGAGKTTLMKHLNGLLRSGPSKISINGYDAATTKTSVLAAQIGFLFQNPDHQIFCSTVYEEIAFGLKNIGKNNTEIDLIVKETASRVGIEAFLPDSPFSLGKGQRQRLALASVLAMNPDVLVLDEPTTGQDYRESLEIMDIIKSLNDKGKTIIMVTHDMELVSLYTQRVIVLHLGRVIEDGPTAIVLGKTDSLALSHLKSPQILELSQKMAKLNQFKDCLQGIFTAEAMFEQILCRVGKING